MKKLRLLLFLALFFISSCSTSPERALAEQAVVDFHDAYNRRDFAAIYKVTGLDYRRMMSESAMQQVLEKTHKRLGKEILSSQTGFYTATTNKTTYITILVETQFADGTAAEKFDFSVHSGKALMEGYHIDVPR